MLGQFGIKCWVRDITYRQGAELGQVQTQKNFPRLLFNHQAQLSHRMADEMHNFGFCLLHNSSQRPTEEWPGIQGAKVERLEKSSLWLDSMSMAFRDFIESLSQADGVLTFSAWRDRRRFLR